MLYGQHAADKAWQQQEEPPDGPDPSDFAIETGPDGVPVVVVPLELFTGDDQSLPNELFDTPEPPDETDRLHTYVEDMLSQSDYHEQLMGDPYSGTDLSDPGFWDDRDWE